MNFKPEICQCCGQSKTYALAIDKGTTDTLRAISIAIGRKGINIIHPRKEMEWRSKDISQGLITSNQVGNLTKARVHGLIAKIKGQPGNYCLTTKGANFLRGGEIPRVAIIDKVIGHQIGYFNPEDDKVSIRSFVSKEEYWEGINYTILEGRVIHDPKEIQKTLI